MPKKQSAPSEPVKRGFRAANPELYDSPPSSEWESRGLLKKKADPNDATKFTYQFDLPAGFPQSWAVQVPPISFGDNAPMPRWRLALNLRDPAEGRDLEEDLISTGKDTTIIEGLAPNSHPRSFDSSIGLGGLQWIFEPGLPGSLLSGALLYEAAYMCLIEALKSQIARTQIRREIASGPLWPKVCNVEDPLPPPPQKPETKYFEKYQGKRDSSNEKSDVKTYKRSRSDVRPRGWTPASEEETTYADRIWYHDKGTQGPLHQADPREVLRHSRKKHKKETRKEGKIEKIDRGGHDPAFPKSEEALDSRRLRNSQPDDIITRNRRRIRQSISKQNDPGTASHETVTRDSPKAQADEGLARLSASDGEEEKGAPNKREQAIDEDPGVSRATQDNKTRFALKKHGRKSRTKKTVSFNDEATENVYKDTITKVSKMQKTKSNDLRPQLIEISESDDSDHVREANVSRRFPTFAPGDVNMTLDENNDYLHIFKEACKDPGTEKKYFPLPNAVRRIRPWAGADIPPEIEEKVRACLPKFPSTHRPFLSTRALANAAKEKLDKKD
ncbi:hypothetical protein N7450_004869 [Penicillium hetheringtonii]|uniref:Uncharacterized protein n=1 Tax=Penicillium hetheringtonii TaxID=911720 RepID=A0AAD6GVL4_9EURO|nr:hypothetical protein N7450_004869 [Penicillium hetheringtonii]